MVGPSSLTSASTSLRKSLGVRGRMSGLVDAAIDAASEMLDEGAEQAGIGIADGEIAIHQNFCFSHFLSDVLN